MGGNADFISWLLSIDEVEVNSKGGDNINTPIHIAAIIGNVAGILPFIESDKANLDIKDVWETTPLTEAAERGYIDIVKALVESDRVDVNSQDDMNRTPLSHAAQRGHFEVVRFLLGTENVNANEVDSDGKSPLHHAVTYQREEIVTYLLHSGQVDASLSVKDNSGRTSLDWALAMSGRDHSITELILDRMEAIGISTEARVHTWEICQQFPYASLYDLDDIDNIFSRKS